MQINANNHHGMATLDFTFSTKNVLTSARALVLNF
jgi:hypothetical protein